MKKLLIFIMIIIFSPIVFAKEFNISSKIKPSVNGSTGKYNATEIYEYGTNSNYSIGTRYNGRLSEITFYLDSDDWDWSYNTTYTITLNMATSDWRNNFMGPQVFRTNTDGSIPSTATNFYVSNTFQFVSMKKIKFNFKIGSTMGVYTKFHIYSGNINSTAITGVSNWNLSSIIISTITSPTATPAPVTPTPTPRPATPTPRPDSTNQDIINNQNSNTQSIINNQNSNTQSIINNQNSNTSSITNNQNTNTQNIIDSNTQNTSDIIENNNSNTEQLIDTMNNTCTNGPNQYNFSDYVRVPGQYLKNDGTISISTSWGLSRYFSIKPKTDYNISLNTGNNPSLCFYRSKSNDSLISCIQYSNSSSLSFTSPNNANYMVLSLYYLGGATITGPICNNWESEKQDTTNDKLDELNNSINNSSIDNKGSFFSDFEDNTHGLTGIITLPLSTIQSLTNNTCVPLSIPIPFTNSNISLPCMTQVYQTYIPSVYSVWQVVSFGIISYFICLDIFKMVKGFKDPNEDKIEVLDL